MALFGGNDGQGMQSAWCRECSSRFLGGIELVADMRGILQHGMFSKRDENKEGQADTPVAFSLIAGCMVTYIG